MARRGRLLERLVHLIESAFAGLTVTVKSPDYLESETGAKREVDVSIRGRIGHNEVLIICECRDRKAKADEPWIEQLVEKRRAVKADKVIAISASGFTRAATEKAIMCGISARTLKDLDIAQIQSWCEMESASMLSDSIRIHHFNFVPAEDPENKAQRVLSQSVLARIKQTLRVPILRTSRSGAISVVQLVESWRSQHFDFEVPVGVSMHRIGLRDADGPMWIESEDGEIELSHVEVVLEIRRCEVAIPITRAVEYADRKGGLAQLVQFGSDPDADTRTPLTFTVVRGGDGVMKVFLRDNRGENPSPPTTPR